MARLTVEKNGKKFLVTLLDPEVVESWEATFTSDRDVQKVARAAKTTMHWVRTHVKEIGEHEIPQPEPTTPTAAIPAGPQPVYVRGMGQVGETRREFASIHEALACADLTVPEPLIFWEGMDHLCSVDADMHHIEDHDKRLKEVQLRTRFVNIQPAPRYIWITHGKGLRLIYEAMGGYTAQELAAVAASRVLQLEPSLTVELKTATRHPLYPNDKGKMCGRVEERVQSTDVSAVLGWYSGRGDVNEDTLQLWLEQHQLEIGKRYEHTRCPVEPHVPSHGDPVMVYDNGIMCYGCQGHNVCRGSRAPGWFSFPALLGTPVVSDVARCVENFVHWEHARFVLSAHLPLSQHILRGVYETLLKGHHGTDPRIPLVFTAGEDIVRFHKRWGTLAGEAFSNQFIKPILENLPKCQYIDTEKHALKTSQEMVSRLIMHTKLSRYGYPHLRPIWGLPMNRYFKPYPYEIVLFHGKGEQPRYLRPSERIPEEEAWARVQNAFPGHVRSVIQLLICAKGCAEFDGTWPPFVFIEGPTKSSKTTSVHLAAAIAGDAAHSVPCISDDEKIRAAIVAAKEKGTYCLFNEAAKDAMRTRRGKAEAMEFALGLTADSMSHKLYVGPVEMGQLPVCVWTDVEVPQEVKENSQLARRIIHVRLARKVDWHTTMLETGMGKAEDFRKPIHGDRSYIAAADCILSTLMDRFFTNPMNFEKIANELGFHTLADSDDTRKYWGELRTFFELVQQTPKHGDSDSVLIDLTSMAPLTQMWKQLADAPSYTSSQRLQEQQWSEVLGTEGDVKFDVTRRGGSRVLVKFTGDVNGSIRGHRDAIRGGPDGRGSEEIYIPRLDTLDDAGGQDEGRTIRVGAPGVSDPGPATGLPPDSETGA